MLHQWQINLSSCVIFWICWRSSINTTNSNRSLAIVFSLSSFTILFFILIFWLFYFVLYSISVPTTNIDKFIIHSNNYENNTELNKQLYKSFRPHVICINQMCNVSQWTVSFSSSKLPMVYFSTLTQIKIWLYSVKHSLSNNPFVSTFVSISVNPELYSRGNRASNIWQWYHHTNQV